MDRMYVEGHRPAMGWWDAHGFHAACECGAESGPCPSRATAEKVIQVHLMAEAERGVVVIEQDDAAEAPDEPAPDYDGDGPVPYGSFPAGF